MIIRGSEVRQYLSQFLQHFSDLTKEDRYNRFFHTVSIDSIRDWLLSLEDRETEEHVFKVIIGDDDEFQGIAQLACHKATGEGDMSLSVIPQCQRMGLGERLLEGIVEIAKEKELKSLNFICELGNHGSRNLCSKMGFNYAYDPEQECISGSLNLYGQN